MLVAKIASGSISKPSTRSFFYFLRLQNKAQIMHDPISMPIIENPIVLKVVYKVHIGL